MKLGWCVELGSQLCQITQTKKNVVNIVWNQNSAWMNHEQLSPQNAQMPKHLQGYIHMTFSPKTFKRESQIAKYESWHFWGS
jgi:hypothetical protein